MNKRQRTLYRLFRRILLVEQDGWDGGYVSFSEYPNASADLILDGRWDLTEQEAEALKGLLGRE